MHVVHATMKGVSRVFDKVGSDYDQKSKPTAKYVKDILRITVEVDDHRALEAAVQRLASKHEVVELKNRLSLETHDVVAVIRFDNVLCEVQFSFHSVLLLKSFASVAYTVVRLKVGSNHGVENYIHGMILALLQFPAYDGGGLWRGGYKTGERSKEEIQVKLQL